MNALPFVIDTAVKFYLTAFSFFNNSKEENICIISETDPIIKISLQLS